MNDRPYDWEQDDPGRNAAAAARQHLLEEFRSAIKRIENKQVTAEFSALIAAQDDKWVWRMICAGKQLAEND